jgi:hypothetical protein
MIKSRAKSKYSIAFTNHYTPTNALLCIVFILKFVLKHLKRSYVFRSADHHQGAHIVPCWCYVKMISKTLRYFNRWCGSISCVLRTLFLVQGGRGILSPFTRNDMLPHMHVRSLSQEPLIFGSSEFAFGFRRSYTVRQPVPGYRRSHWTSPSEDTQAAGYVDLCYSSHPSVR